MKLNFLTLLFLLSVSVLFTNVYSQDKSNKRVVDLTGDFNPKLVQDSKISEEFNSDAVTGAWSTLAVSPKAQSRTCVVYIANGGTEYLYQFGGGSGTQLKSIAQYNITTNTWTSLVPALIRDVSSGSAIADGDSVIYIFGGNSGTTTLGSTQKFNIITGVVTNLATMPNLITDAAVVKYHDSLIYVIGGGTGLFGAGYISNVNVYNIKTNTYTAATSYPIAAGMMGFGIDGSTIICAGGWDGVTGTPNAYKGVIDPSNHLNITWTALPNYPGGGVTRSASYKMQKGTQKGIVFTGGALLGATLQNKTYFFNMNCESWDSTVVLPLARSNFKAAGRGDSVVWAVAGFTTVGVGQNDRLTVSDISCGLLTNDVGTQTINSPPASIILPSASITPQATVKNFGTATQTFNVTMTISPGGYSNTQTVTGLATLGTSNVNFASYTPTAGSFTVTVYTELATDENRSNDTLRKSISAYNPNFGGIGPFNSSSYSYANSTPDASGAPSQPGYCRLDTAGSTSLVVNSVASIALTNGSLDDGHWGILLGTPRKIKFMGVTYDSIYIGTNGVLGFVNFVPGGGNWDPPANGLPGNGSGGISRPAIYPLWNDMNWGNTSQPVNRLSYKIDNTKNQLIITYDRAPLFGGTAADFVTFQTCIELQADTAGAPNSNIVVGYDNFSTAVNIPLLAGLQDATGTNWLQYAFINASATVVTAGPIFDTLGAGVSIAFGPDEDNLNGHCKELNLTAMFEGYWDGTTYLGDTIVVQIRSSIAPYPVIESHKVTNDGSGFAAIDVGIANNTDYYIVVSHRNTIRTWSQLVQWTGTKLTYDFTSAQTMAFGNNLTLKAGRWCIYSGDITQDGVVDGSDGALIDNDAANFETGPYLITDLNWDTVVDGADALYTDNNGANFVSEIAP